MRLDDETNNDYRAGGKIFKARGGDNPPTPEEAKMKFDFFGIETTADGSRVYDLDDWCYVTGYYKTLEEAEKMLAKLEARKNEEMTR
jgi:hypothetical protein